MTEQQSIGIFGATFDPPHKAHLNLVDKLIESSILDEVIVVPSKYPPGKSAVAPFDQRLSWTQKIFSGRKHLKISDLEKKSSQTIFGVDIFRTLSLEHPNAQFFWILGEDQWDQLPFWHAIDTYASLIVWIVVPRSHPNSKRLMILSRRLRRSSCSYLKLNDFFDPQVSSSKIRDSIHHGDFDSSELKWVPELIRDDVIETYKTRRPI